MGCWSGSEGDSAVRQTECTPLCERAGADEALEGPGLSGPTTRSSFGPGCLPGECEA